MGVWGRRWGRIWDRENHFHAANSWWNALPRHKSLKEKFLSEMTTQWTISQTPTLFTVFKTWSHWQYFLEKGINKWNSYLLDCECNVVQGWERTSAKQLCESSPCLQITAAGKWGDGRTPVKCKHTPPRKQWNECAPLSCDKTVKRLSTACHRQKF